MQFSLVASAVLPITVLFVMSRSWSHSALQSALIWPRVPPKSILILRLSLTGCSHKLRVHDVQSYRYCIEFLSCFLRAWKRQSLKYFWTSPTLNMWGCSHWTAFNAPPNQVIKSGILSILTCCILVKFYIRTSKDALVPYMSLSFSIIWGMLVQVLYQVQHGSPQWMHYPPHRVVSWLLCNRLFTSNTHSSNKISPF